MRSARIGLFATLVTFVALPAPAYVKVVMAQSPVQQLWRADAVVVGKVMAVEQELVKASPYPGGEKVAHAVATVKVSEHLLGVTKGITHVRIAFVPGAPDDPNDLQRRNRYNPAGPMIPDQEGCWFLVKHPGDDFYVRVDWGMRMLKQQDGFEEDLGRVRRIAQVLSDPIKSLKSQEAAARGFAAGVMVQKHRLAPRTIDGKTRETELPAEESRLILRGLRELEWGKNESEGAVALQQAWYMLGVNERHGWKQPRVEGNQDANKVMDNAVKQWLADNADTFAIKRYVPVDDGPKK